VRLGSCRVLAQALRGGELLKAAEATAVGGGWGCMMLDGFFQFSFLDFKHFQAI